MLGVGRQALQSSAERLASFTRRDSRGGTGVSVRPALLSNLLFPSPSSAVQPTPASLESSVWLVGFLLTLHVCLCPRPNNSAPSSMLSEGPRPPSPGPSASFWREACVLCSPFQEAAGGPCAGTWRCCWGTEVPLLLGCSAQAEQEWSLEGKELEAWVGLLLL